MAELLCVRCLTPFTKSFSVSTYLDYIEGVDPFAQIDRVELQTTDIDRIYYQGPSIDICIGIREAIILSIPIAPVCVANCRGLCPVCGKNINEQSCKCKIEKTNSFTPQNIRKSSPQKKMKKKQRQKR